MGMKFWAPRRIRHFPFANRYQLYDFASTIPEMVNEPRFKHSVNLLYYNKL